MIQADGMDSENVFQQRSLGANGIGLATHCGKQYLIQPDRPLNGICRVKGR